MTTFDMVMREILSMRAKNGNKILIGGAIGLALGLAAGLLIAPRSGKVSRSLIEKQIRETTRKIKEFVDEAISGEDSMQDETERSIK